MIPVIMQSDAMDRPIVVIDDRPDYLDYVVTLLKRSGFNALGFERAAPALDYVARSNTAVVVTDIFMPDFDGIEVLRRLRQDAPTVAIIGISGTRWKVGSHYLSALRSLGADAVMEKPLDPKPFLREVERLYRRSEDSSAALTPGG